jgi:hypothetical protein
VAEELRDLVSGIDETALVHDGFWETFCDDVAIGDYATGTREVGPVPGFGQPSKLRRSQRCSRRRGQGGTGSP